MEKLSRALAGSRQRKEICARVRIMPFGGRREANIWLHAARRRFGPLCTYGIPQLFNATRLHYTAGTAYTGICGGAATCVLRHRINVAIFRQSRSEILFSLSLASFFSSLSQHGALELSHFVPVGDSFHEFRFNLRVTEATDEETLRTVF